MANIDGVFACGNALHVHDLVDWASLESRNAGRFAALWLAGKRLGKNPGPQINAKAGENVRYVNPAKIDPKRDNHVYLRSMIIKNDAALELRLDGKRIRSIRKSHVQPSEMLSVTIGPDDFSGDVELIGSTLELAIV
jgi:hypothetical protein